jgi:Tfp pilus assembly protein PilF
MSNVVLVMVSQASTDPTYQQLDPTMSNVVLVMVLQASTDPTYQQLDPTMSNVVLVMVSQASTDPTYQQLVAQQAEQQEELGPAEVSQADKDAGAMSVFKRNDDDLKQRRETDVR